MNTVVKMEAETPVVRWLDNNLARGLKAPFAMRGTLTPDLAAVLLERNDANRSVSVKKVDEYASDIAEGRWKLNGEPIIIASDGCMNDGQHRCIAAMQAEASVETFFVFGVDRETRFTVDQGLKRTIGHYLKMRGGLTHTNELAQAGWVAWQFEQFGEISTTKARRPTPSVVQEFLQQTPDIERSVEYVARHPNRTLQVATGATAAVHYLLAKIHRHEADCFISDLLTGANIDSDDPVFVLRAHILSHARTDRRKRLRTDLYCEYLIRAWNARREGRTLQRMAVGKSFPSIQ